MKLRTYKCLNCGEFDELHKDHSLILAKCPHCGSDVKQVLGLHFRLKGPGFYATDNGKMG